jgi:hypothetical protein
MKSGEEDADRVCFDIKATGKFGDETRSVIKR